MPSKKNDLEVFIMRTLRNYLLALTLIVAAFNLVACGSNDDEMTTAIETTSAIEATTNRGNSGNVNDTTSKGGVIEDVGDAVEDGVDDVGDIIKDGADDIESGVNDIIDGNEKTTKKN